jgi:ABC-type transport system involved in multi-copper enzyme maturation permease subunit
MKGFLNALQAELIKTRHSRIVWITFIAFAIAPVMGGMFMLIINNPEALSKAGPLAAKVHAMGVKSSWEFYIGMLTQAMGVGGVLLFGFVASWVFGREYSEGTAKDLLSLPVTRIDILHGKFVLYFLWSAGLALSNLLIGFVIGAVVGLPQFNFGLLAGTFTAYIYTTLLTALLGTPVAFFALLGTGYLAPLGFVSIIMVFAQIIAATGYGHYFPWSIPALYSGAGGELKNDLNLASYFIVLSTGLAGYIATAAWWKFADQTK